MINHLFIFKEVLTAILYLILLQLNETLDEDIQPIRHSPYYDLDNFMLLAERHNKRFNILSTNI